MLLVLFAPSTLFKFLYLTGRYRHRHDALMPFHATLLIFSASSRHFIFVRLSVKYHSLAFGCFITIVVLGWFIGKFQICNIRRQIYGRHAISSIY